jgi:hypothetical protein
VGTRSAGRGGPWPPGHGEVLATAMAGGRDRNGTRVANSGNEERHEWVKEVCKDVAQLPVRAIGWKWRERDEFGWRLEEHGDNRKERKRGRQPARWLKGDGDASGSPTPACDVAGETVRVPSARRR